MKKLSSTRNRRKLIIVFLFVLVFNTIFPKESKAISFDPMFYFGQLIYGAETGILKAINNIFCDDEHDMLETDISPVYLSPETIIKGKFAIFDANIFKDIDESKEYYDVGSDNSIITGKDNLRSIIAGWYYALRNLALIALLSILVYIGIRMIMTSIAQEKAKYISMFKDWLVAICLVMVMHFIMISTLNISSAITEAIGTSGSGINLTQKARDDMFENMQTGNYADTIGQGVVLGAIIVYTVIFAVKYIFRSITIMFLALLAPITCITYPLDKIKDGKSQAFDFWLREFMLEVIIQPFHLLIYVVLIGSASALAESNILYAILCYAMMIPAEKIVKQMFGIDPKLGSPLGAAFGGAAANQVMNSIKNLGKSSGSKDDKEKENEEPESKQKPKEKNRSPYDYDSANQNDNGGTNRDELGDAGRSRSQQEGEPGSGDDDAGEGPGGGSGDNYTPERSDDNSEYNSEELGGGDNNYYPGGSGGESGDNTEPKDNGGYENNNNNNNQPIPQNDNKSKIRKLWENRPKLWQNRGKIVDSAQKKGNNIKRKIKNKASNNKLAKSGPARWIASKANKVNNSEFSTGIKSGLNRMRNKHENRLIDKYGTTNRAKIAGKRALKLAKNTGKRAFTLAAKTALGLGMGAAAALAATVTGDPNKIAAGFAGGMMLGSNLGGKLSNKVSEKADAAEEYLREGRRGVLQKWSENPNSLTRRRFGGEYDEKLRRDKYFSNKEERQKAIDYYKETHNNTMPSTKEINKEMEKRWKYKDQGIDDSKLIDKAVKKEDERIGAIDEKYSNGSMDSQMSEDWEKSKVRNDEVRERLGNDQGYKQDYNQLINGNMNVVDFNKKYGRGEAQKAQLYDMEKNIDSKEKYMEHRKNIEKEDAYVRTIREAKLADDYSKTDFYDNKKMEARRDSEADKYVNELGVSREEANRMATRDLAGAAELKGASTSASLLNNSSVNKENKDTQEKAQRREYNRIIENNNYLQGRLDGDDEFKKDYNKLFEGGQTKKKDEEFNEKYKDEGITATMARDHSKYNGKTYNEYRATKEKEQVDQRIETARELEKKITKNKDFKKDIDSYKNGDMPKGRFNGKYRTQLGENASQKADTYLSMRDQYDKAQPTIGPSPDFYAFLSNKKAKENSAIDRKYGINPPKIT